MNSQRKPTKLTRTPPIIDSASIILKEQLELIKQRSEKPELPIGIEVVDEVLLGFHRKQVCLISGRPGEGKSSFASQCAMNLADVHKKVWYVSLEMPRGDIVEKVMANFCDLDLKDLRKGKTPEDYEQRVKTFDTWLSSTNLVVTDGWGYEAREIETSLEDSKNNLPDIIFLDHINKISQEGYLHRRDAVSNYILAMEKLALKYNIAIVILAQLNREAMKSKLPSLEHLKESGTLEEGAATVLFLRWKTMDKDKKPDPTDTAFEIIVGKQRYGDAGIIIDLHFLANYGRFVHYRPTMFSQNGSQFNEPSRVDVPERKDISG